jgi:hypothetical protein
LFDDDDDDDDCNMLPFAGFEFPVNVTDCCNCPAIRCDLCPVKETPKCTKGCQVKQKYGLQKKSMPLQDQCCKAPCEQDSKRLVRSGKSLIRQKLLQPTATCLEVGAV